MARLSAADDKSPQSDPPISVLPLEILPVIFFEALQVSRSKSSTIFTISQVSQLWKSIAVSTPNLWTFIDTTDTGIIRTMIIRSKDKPLSIALKEVKEDNRQPIILLLESLHRIRSFELSIYYTTDWTRMGSFEEWSNPAPLLEILDLDGICLPDDLFSGDLPSLRHLSLDSHDIDVEKIPHCPQLRSFILIRPEEQVRVEPWLRRLATFPLLERVDAVGIFEENSGADVRLDPVELPHLQLLLIDAEEMHNIAPLLEHLRVPSTCKFKIEVHQQESDEHLLLFPALSICRTGTLGPIRKLKVVADGWLGLKITEGPKQPHFTHAVYDTAHSRRPTFHFTIWPPWGDRTRRTIELATRICQHHLNLTNLDTLDLLSKDVADFPKDSFWELVDSLSSLRALKVRQIYANSFIKYIYPALKSTDTSHLPFSQVPKIVYEDPSSDAEGYPVRLTALVQYLRLRADQGLALTSLNLVHVKMYPKPISDEVLGSLVRLVKRVKRKVKGIIHDDKAKPVGVVKLKRFPLGGIQPAT